MKKPVLALLFSSAHVILPSLTWAAGSMSCSPSSCTPAGCGQSCTYYTCNGTASVSISSSQLPFTYSQPGNACDDEWSNGQEFKALPLSSNGSSKTELPLSFSHTYSICGAQTNTAPACPPPSPAPTASTGCVGWCRLDSSGSFIGSINGYCGTPAPTTCTAQSNHTASGHQEDVGNGGSVLMNTGHTYVCKVRSSAINDGDCP